MDAKVSTVFVILNFDEYLERIIQLCSCNIRFEGMIYVPLIYTINTYLVLLSFPPFSKLGIILELWFEESSPKAVPPSSF